MRLKAVIVTALVSVFACAMAQEPQPAKGGASPAPIHSTTELNRYLKATTNTSTPLYRLSPLARKRFIDSLEFRDGALIDYKPTDLAAELSAEEIRSVLGIFGEEPYEYLLTLARPAPRKTAPPVTPTIIERHFDAFIRIADAHPVASEKQHNLSIAKAYDELFSAYTGKATELDDYDLEFVFRAARTNVFYNPTPEYARSATRLLAEVQSRGLSRQSDFNYLYRALLGARLFDEAREFAARHPSSDRKPLPQLRDIPNLAGATAWMVDMDKRVLTRQPVSLNKPAQIVVVSSPLCHFSQDAARDIRNDPTLGQLFKQHATWLNPPLGETDFDDVQAWNREHPDQTMMLAYAKQDWPMFEDWATPIFYILKDGKLVETVRGWRTNEPHDALSGALMRAGLLPSQP